MSTSEPEVQSFEAAFTELQERVTRLEDGELTLEETIEEFREATRLTQSLERMIADAELRITELSRTDEVTQASAEDDSW